MASPPVQSAQEVSKQIDEVEGQIESYFIRKALPWIIGIGALGLIILSSDSDKEAERE